MTSVRMPEALDTSRPIMILGGEVNAVALARHLAPLGIEIFISGTEGTWGMWSRHCSKAFPVPSGKTTHEHWRELLLSPDDTSLDGCLLFALNDDAITFLIAHHAPLSRRYTVERFVPELRAAMLDKAETLILAEAAGVPVPQHWPVTTAADVERLRDKITFPVMVKPIHSHRFVEAFGRKLFIIEDDFEQVLHCVGLAEAREIEVMVVEMIPGSDELLSSYYTYIDENGANLFHYTKRVVRRFPPNRGGAVYHVSEWLPETAKLGQKFFAHVGWRGLANIEFKRDPRDGQYKVIEVNARYTAAHRLVVRSGAPIDLIAYCDLTGQPGPRFDSYVQDMTYWYPLRDFRAFLALRRQGQLTLLGWLRSIPLRRTVFPLFSYRDPMPSVVRMRQSLSGLMRKLRPGPRGKGDAA
ncbi:carboxylate--amine ligase [Oceanibium sediminis]|uniref:carboxylate--amine ligase n=1 Tax=Oceanibium sediminis TaxID=2026339 RepID=UPI0013006F17|nr:carboxylate--amine ligase [Oceanibium sediminis]